METKSKQSHNQVVGQRGLRKKILEGIIFSAKMEKTVVVLVKRLVEHKKYRKRYWISKKYKAHNPQNQYKEGQKVTIKESRPLSKSKRWVIISES